MLGGDSQPIDEIIGKFAPRAGHFHINDINNVNLLDPGMGPTVCALQETNYPIWISVENFDYSPGGAEKITRDSRDQMN